ncbi:MAG: hypothetical protein KatS3mg102_1236 [Planctomycetota bacterium]|nr:MAG: hypothetical protein KatS3mg102_1236 [Planctomycetota bacterium]
MTALTSPLRLERSAALPAPARALRSRPRSDRARMAGVGATAGESEVSAEHTAENELIAQAKRGNEAAFRALVERYRKRVYWVAYHMVGDEQDAVDIAQEAFVRVYRSLKRFDPRYRFYTWLYRIVSNLAVDYLRKRGARRNVSFDELGEMDGGSLPVHARLEQRELAERVRRVLDRLPPAYRQVMVLRELEGFTAKEVADMVDSTHATVRWRLHRARALFREQWEKLYGDGGEAAGQQQLQGEQERDGQGDAEL